MFFIYRVFINIALIFSPLIICIRLLKKKEDLKRFKETGNIGDFKTNLKAEKRLIEDILGDIGKDDKIKGGSIEDLYYDKDGKLTYTPGGAPPPPIVTQVNNNNQDITYLPPVSVVDRAVTNPAKIFGN